MNKAFSNPPNFLQGFKIAFICLTINPLFESVQAQTLEQNHLFNISQPIKSNLHSSPEKLEPVLDDSKIDDSKIDDSKKNYRFLFDLTPIIILSNLELKKLSLKEIQLSPNENCKKWLLLT